MKKTLLILLSMLCCMTAARAQKVLYLGNGYTYVNDTPSIMDTLARSQGHNFSISSNSKSGYTMNNHLSNKESRALIDRGGWDVVILQDQSTQPVLVGMKEGMPVVESMVEMVERIRKSSPSARILMEITWGRKDGNNTLIDKFKDSKYSHIFASFDSMQEALTRGITAEAMMCRTDIADVGKVWKYLRGKYPQIELYTPDGSHSSYAGSFLATCVIYTAITGEKIDAKSVCSAFGNIDAKAVPGSTEGPKISPKTAKTICKAVWKNK